MSFIKYMEDLVTEVVQSAVGLLPPPRASDVLFGGGDDFATNACIAHWGDVGYAYENGFRAAAFHLAEMVCETGRDQDSLIYPIVYLYRHHVELVLKDIFRIASALLDEKISTKQDEVLRKHELVPLWEMVRPMLNMVCLRVGSNQLPVEDLEGLSSYIRQIHDYDPDGQRFRYATVRKPKSGAPKGTYEYKRSLELELTLINIRAFAINIEKMAEYIGSLRSWFAYLLQAKIDAEYEANA